jgi:hypothetical protein
LVRNFLDSLNELEILVKQAAGAIKLLGLGELIWINSKLTQLSG